MLKFLFYSSMGYGECQKYILIQASDCFYWLISLCYWAKGEIMTWMVFLEYMLAPSMILAFMGLGFKFLLSEIRLLRKELKGDIKSLESTLKGDIKSLESTLKGDIKSLESTLKGDIKSLQESQDEMNTRLSRLEGYFFGPSIHDDGRHHKKRKH